MTDQTPDDPSAPISDIARAAAMSDGELLTLLQKDADLLHRVQVRATSAHDTVRRLPLAPVEHIDRLWQSAQRRVFEISRSTPPCNPRSPADWAAKIQMLRVALGVIQELQVFADMTSEQRREALPRYRAEAELRAYNAEHGAIVARGEAAQAAAPAWSPAGFIGGLARKGVTLSVDSDGNLRGTSASHLTEGEPETLRSRKAAIVAELSAAVLVA